MSRLESSLNGCGVFIHDIPRRPRGSRIVRRGKREHRRLIEKLCAAFRWMLGWMLTNDEEFRYVLALHIFLMLSRPNLVRSSGRFA